MSLSFSAGDPMAWSQFMRKQTGKGTQNCLGWVSSLWSIFHLFQQVTNLWPIVMWGQDRRLWWTSSHFCSQSPLKLPTHLIECYATITSLVLLNYLFYKDMRFISFKTRNRHWISMTPLISINGSLPMFTVTLRHMFFQKIQLWTVHTKAILLF